MLRGKSVVEDSDTLLAKGLIPIIDLAHCGTEEHPVKSVVNRVGLQLQKALPEKGFALLVNHGILEEKLKVAWQHLDNFCSLSSDVKEHYINNIEGYHGYNQNEEENSEGEHHELRYAFNITTLKISNVHEDPLPGFEEHINELAHDFKLLAGFILQSLAVSLDLNQSFLYEKHCHMLSGDNESKLCLLYYPPILEDNEKNELFKGRLQYTYQKCASDTPDFRPESDCYKTSDVSEGATALGQQLYSSGHIDYGTFTLLAQDSEGGLEVKLPGSEKWQRVGHLPGSIFINAGEMLSIWTENRYPALSHRVIIPEQEHLRVRGRHSIAFFCHPDNITMIDPTDIHHNSSTEDDLTKPRKKHVKIAKEKVYNAYQLIKRRFKKTSNSS
ncbi:hypothetical protein ACFFRR_005514 [Megaselia abdita]